MTKKSYEASMEELEKLVDNLEANDVPLEEALKNYEKGIGLIRNCHDLINQAEGKFKVLNGEVEKVLNLKEATPATLEDLENQ
jgi:exodeoxyribonuclease VII small subunit